MKYLILLLITTYSQATYWSIESIITAGYSSKIECKNGYLIDIIYGKYGNYDIHVEQSHCTDRSSWDHDCRHKPIKCKKGK